MFQIISTLQPFELLLQDGECKISFGGKNGEEGRVYFASSPFCPPDKACLGWSALSYPGAEDFMDSPYCQP